MTRPGPDDPVVLDSATGEWLPGLPAPGLIAAGRGHAWQMTEGIWRLAEPDDDEEAVYRAVRVAAGRVVCMGSGCVRTGTATGDSYVCPGHVGKMRRVRPRNSGVDMSSGLSEGDTQTGGPPDTTDPARSRRKEPDMARSRAATEDLTAAKPKRPRKADHPMTNAGSPEHVAATAAAKGRRRKAGEDIIPSESLGPVVNPDGTPTETTVGILTGMRHCIGAPKFGIDPHEAPVAAFGKHNRGPGGLSRMCRADWKVYAKALAASKAGEPVTTIVTEGAVAAPRLPRVRAPRTPEQEAKAEKVAAAKAKLATIDALPAPEAVVAIGTDEAQDALAVIADASLGSRVESAEGDDD